MWSSRKSRFVIVLFLALLLAAACGDDTDQAEGDDTDQTETETLRVAMVLPGKADDIGYSQLGAIALDKVKEELDAETALAESIPVAQQLEAFRDFATQGYNVIFGWGGQWQDGIEETAKEFPDTHFVVVDGVGGNRSNLSSAYLAGEQWTFLVGYADANVSESGVIGLVGGPCFDSTAREVHGYQDGVALANPEVEVKIVTIDSFDDPSGAKEASLALMEDGADVLRTSLNTGNAGVFEAVKGTDVLVSTGFFDQHDLAPRNIYTSDIRDSTEIGTVAVERVLDGSFDGEPIIVSLTEDEEAIAEFRGLAPDSLYQEVKELQVQVATEEIAVEPDSTCPYA